MGRLFDALGSLWDPVEVMRASRLRIGKVLRAQGPPAILMGVSFVVVAAGVARAIQSAAPAIADGLREGRNLLESMRRRPLNP